MTMNNWKQISPVIYELSFSNYGCLRVSQYVKGSNKYKATILLETSNLNNKYTYFDANSFNDAMQKANEWLNKNITQIISFHSYIQCILNQT